MEISLAPLRPADAPAIVEAEDALTVRWLSGGESTVEGTAAYIDRLARDAEAGRAKRAFGIWAEGCCVGTIDYDPEVADGLDAGDVNIAYGVAPWMRGRGVAVRAVELICAVIRERGIGTRAVIRADARNPASARVAEKAGFVHLRDVESTEETREDGSPVVLKIFGRPVDPESAASS
ncbi:GNAT family N-acetyltransferase [Brachybacterium hainanense]|uniref:GNAT family N-acetyltransferase n=1 Tax=Brachybacterium hainanense TaxID=1541174 RepID=A0ABV6R9N9_9MICO